MSYFDYNHDGELSFDEFSNALHELAHNVDNVNERIEREKAAKSPKREKAASSF